MKAISLRSLFKCRRMQTQDGLVEYNMQDSECYSEEMGRCPSLQSSALSSSLQLSSEGASNLAGVV